MNSLRSLRFRSILKPQYRRGPRQLRPRRTFASEVQPVPRRQVYLGEPAPLSKVFQAPFIDNGRIHLQEQGSSNGRTFPVSLQWLRDHCSCDQCVHPSTKQRLVETFYDIPADIQMKNVTEDANGFQVKWSDGHESQYNKEWLQVALPSTRAYEAQQAFVTPTLWTGSEIKKDPPTVNFKDVMDTEQGLLQWLEKIRSYGFCYVDETPVDPVATEKLIERIAYIRNTHYGGFWDFTSDLSKGDTAYTSLGIGPHTDNTYFSDPAGLQLFHLLSHTNGDGGASQLVDGFYAAQKLREEDPEAYEILSTVGVASHASGNEDSSIQPYCSFPTLVHHPTSHHLIQVRWNTTDRAQIDLGLDEIDRWYAAARKWANILKEAEYWEQLVPGKALMFDNWRVLHGRSAFTGKRRMCGGYINRDDYISRFKMLKYGREEVLRQVSAV